MPSSVRCLMTIISAIAGNVLFTLPVAVTAGMRPQVDVSLQVTTAPVPFVPGGHAVVTMTVHNAGPDAAGATVPNQDTIVVFEDGFIITTQPPPFTIPAQGEGCVIDTYVSDPLPNGDIGLVYIFYFDSIAAGESRVCTYGIDFDPSIRNDFATGWLVTSSNDDDSDLSNNRADYVFQGSPHSIPILSWQGLAVLGTGLLAIGWRARRRMLMAPPGLANNSSPTAAR